MTLAPESKAQRLRRPERLARLECPRVLAALAPLPPRVLDIGTGSGVFAEQFLAAGAREVSGMDLDAELIDAARQWVPGAAFSVAGAEHLPFTDGSFGLAFMGLVLHESPDPLAALREARRVAERLAVLEWAYRQEEGGPPLERRFPPERLLNLAQAAGWGRGRVEALTEFSLYLFPA
ncbi:class I SAM-dependent methyltransferase [Deinococcus lacus]|uniref:Class I SAM-dependent methyltransferase n=1 Tax=Deinococcus lacus TaxID=392561 RepID=A0ABW1YBM8_9DEIO